MGVLGVLIVLIGVMAYFGRDPFPVVPPPELGDGPINLRVVRALNPRFPELSQDEFAEVLDQASVLVKDHFGLDVRFERGRDYAIDELFLLMPDPVLDNAFRPIFRLPNLIEAPDSMVEFITSFLRVILRTRLRSPNPSRPKFWAPPELGLTNWQRLLPTSGYGGYTAGKAFQQ